MTPTVDEPPVVPQTLSRAELWAYFEYISLEQREILESHQHRVAFYSSILTAILGGLVAILIQATAWYHFLIAGALGSVLIVIICSSAIAGTHRFYQAFLEKITVRAKLEDDLGLTAIHTRPTKPDDGYWRNEPYVPERHTTDRNEHLTSSDFVNQRSKMGYQKEVLRLFTLMRWLSLPIFVIFAILAWFAAHGYLISPPSTT